MCYASKQVDDHCEQLGNDDARDQVIESLAEGLMSAATLAAVRVIGSSQINVPTSDIVKAMSHNDKFNDLYYAIAERMIKAHERG